MSPTLITDRSVTKLFQDYHFLWKCFYPLGCGKTMQSFDYKTEVPHAGKQKSLLNINWLSFSDLEANCALMEPDQFTKVRSIFEKSAHLDNHAKKKINSIHYIGNTLLATMADFEYSDQMCRCGLEGETRADLPCSKWKYCDRCANTRRRFMFSKYGDSYVTNDPHSYFITITKKEKVAFVDGNYEQIVYEWNSINEYVDALIDAAQLTGGLRVEELSFDTFYPVAVANPHVHILCHGKRHIQTHETDDLKVHVIEIKDVDTWLRELNYINEPIDFWSPYNECFTVEHAEKINRNLREAFGGHKYAVLNRNQSRAFGSFHAKSKACNSTAIKTVVRKKSTLQKGKKKIEYSQPSMYEDFQKGVESQLNKKLGEAPLLKLAYNELTTPPEEKKRPWYKNPWVIGGGLAAGAAGLYGAGKYINSGDNIINKSFGSAVDNNIVNPIKNFFNPPAQTTPPTAQNKQDLLSFRDSLGVSPINRLQLDHAPKVLDAHTGHEIPMATASKFMAPPAKSVGGSSVMDLFGNYKGSLTGQSPLRPEFHLQGMEKDPAISAMTSAQSQLYDRVLHAVDLKGQANAAIGNSLPGSQTGSPGSPYEHVSLSNLKGMTRDLGDYANTNVKLNPKTDLSQIINFNPLQPGAYSKNFTDQYNDFNADKAISATKHLPDSIARVDASQVHDPLKQVAGATMGADLLAKSVTNTPAISKLTGSLAAPFAMAYDGLQGYEYAKNTGADPTANALTGMGLGLYGTVGSPGIPGPLKLPAAVTYAAAYPVANHAVQTSNNAFVNNVGKGDVAARLNEELSSALKEVRENKNAVPLQGLMASGHVRNMLSDPKNWSTTGSAVGLDPKTMNLLEGVRAVGPHGVLNRDDAALIDAGIKSRPAEPSLLDRISAFFDH